MYSNKKIYVVVPAHNEEKQIIKVIETMPDFVDKIVIVDDSSTDNTFETVEKISESDKRIILLKNETNLGCGASLAKGFKWVLSQDAEIIVRMDGDGQMNPDDLEKLVYPVTEGLTDFAKGNRFFSGKAYEKMPKVRYYGTAFLSLLTKIASGYWQISDFQSGYTAMNRDVLKTIDWDSMYKSYGQPNDLIVRLNVANFRIADVPVEPVYNVGEKSGMNIKKVMFTLSWLLLKLFFWRMKEKYVIRDFHPLVLFYFLAFFFGCSSFLLFLRVFYFWVFVGHIPPINALAAMFTFISASQFTLFGMWLDMEANRSLRGGRKAPII
ncbi:glycosyltransferase family 2 protein [Desulforegula conservatrix]|uniref:glycosyltransferase family 2 protein n=1 Tax=Desulforegula conservatrix TaxID=153026 RepID=UPI000428C853|nr:glycosyltransferase family 2 protein [Desulforegula conservatrix]